MAYCKTAVKSSALAMEVSMLDVKKTFSFIAQQA